LGRAVGGDSYDFGASGGGWKERERRGCLGLRLNLSDRDAGLLRSSDLLWLRRRRQNDGRDTGIRRTIFFADGARVKISALVHQKRRDFLLAGLVEDKRRACIRQRLAILARDFDSQDQAIGIGADEQIALGVERQRARVPLITLIKNFSLAVRSHDEDLTGIASGDE